jgi:spore maturation protein CgeB
MSIVYCGELLPGGTCRMRCEALRNLGHDIAEVDSTYVPTGFVGLSTRVRRKIGYTADPVDTNARLKASVARYKPNLVWVDKGLTITPDTLQKIRKSHPDIQIVHYSPDDMMGSHNQSRQYLGCIPLFDLHVTTKSFNVEELHARGARSVLFVNNAYSPESHRPLVVNSEDRFALGGDVGFIGTFEEDRARSLLLLANQGIQVRIWGNAWGRWAKHSRHPNLIVENRALYDEDYAKAICSFKINLGFLRKLNRDLQTQRSVEIPACGSFMLAERTIEHLGLFTEGVEAEFFSNEEELLEKCRYYLEHSEARQRVAEAGRERCLRSGYSYEHHVAAVLEHLGRLRTHGC